MRTLFFVLAFTAAAAIAADHSDLDGTWQLSTGHNAKLKFETLLIQQSPDGIKLTESGGKDKALDVTCGVDAKQCKLHDGEFSFWYNGPALVMMETHHNGELITKTRIVPGGDGKTLSLEVTRVEPAGASATYTFTKQP